MTTLQQLSVFLASPGDCGPERAIVRRVVEEYNASLAKSRSVRVEVVGWDTHARPAAGKDGQALINDQIADMKQHALFVGLLWNRFGTPTPRASSGTQEEFELAVKVRGRRAKGQPEIMFYFNEAPFSPHNSAELDQKAQVLAFKTGLKNTLYWTFDGATEFEVLFRRHYGDWLNQTIESLQTKAAPAAKATKTKKEQTALPGLALHDFHFYPEDFYGEPKNGPFYPKALQEAIATTLAFTIASSSPVPIRIQNVFVRVLEASVLKQATFPAYETGGNGITPVLGWTELEQAPGSYQVKTNAKWNVGRGLDPADFHIRTFCKRGSKFKVGIEVEWMNLDEQEQVHRHAFTKELQVEMPELLEWKVVVKKAKKLRVVFSWWDARFFIEDLLKMHVQADLAVLAPFGDAFEKPDFTSMTSLEFAAVWQKSVVAVPEKKMKSLVDVVEGITSNAAESDMRGLIIADGEMMLVEKGLEMADLIEDRHQLDAVVRAFDDLEQRFASPK